MGILGTVRKWLRSFTFEERALASDLKHLENAIEISDPAAIASGFDGVHRKLSLLEKHADHPDAQKLLGAACFDTASLYRNLGKWDDALRHYHQAISYLTPLLGNKKHGKFARTQLAACHNHCALVHMDTGALDQASDSLERAINARYVIASENADDSENRVYLGGALCNRGLVSLMQSDKATAKSYYEKSLAELDTAIPPCTCGCQDAIAHALSSALQRPHWLLLGIQFKENASEGLKQAQ